MAVSGTSATRWGRVHGLEAEKDSEVKVELRMSRSVARCLAKAGAAGVVAVGPGRKDAPAGDVGSAVLGLLTSATPIHRVKQRIGALNQ